MVFYTDGLTEAENRKQDQFGEERLLDLLSHNRFASAAEVDAFLKAEVENFRDGAEVNDDMTLLCMMLK